MSHPGPRVNILPAKPNGGMRKGEWRAIPNGAWLTCPECGSSIRITSRTHSVTVNKARDGEVEPCVDCPSYDCNSKHRVLLKQWGEVVE